MKNNIFWEKIGSWFFNTVYRSHEWDTVIKVPKATSWIINQTHSNIQYALSAHQDYLGMRLPETKIVSTKDSSLGYVFEQQYIHGTKTTIENLQNPDLGHEITAMIQAGESMQKNEKIYFDPYGMSDFIKNIWKLIGKKPIVLGNVLVDWSPNLHYIDVWYIRTDRIGFVNNVITQLMHNLTWLK
jgi:hypothetical protein